MPHSDREASFDPINNACYGTEAGLYLGSHFFKIILQIFISVTCQFDLILKFHKKLFSFKLKKGLVKYLLFTGYNAWFLRLRDF